VSAFASSTSVDQVIKVLQERTTNFDIGSESRPIVIVTADQEEFKFCDRIEAEVKGVVMDPGDWHYQLNVLKAIMIIYGQAGLIRMSSILGIDTVDIDKVKDFNKTFDIIKAVFYTGVILYHKRYEDEMEKKTTNLAFGEWRLELRQKHPNHMLWIDLLFEFLPAFFSLRRMIRKGTDEDYPVRSAAWRKLSPLFAVTNKSKYLEVFALKRRNELEHSEMVLEAIKLSYRTGLN